MADHDLPAAITATEMAKLCMLSRSRLYGLIAEGVMPPPIKTESSKRPVYVRELIAQVLEIRRSGVGANGQLVTFNKKRKQRSSQIPQRRTTSVTGQANGEFDEIINGLKSLGLDPTATQVADLIADRYPTGVADVDPGEVIRSLFLMIKQRE